MFSIYIYGNVTDFRHNIHLKCVKFKWFSPFSPFYPFITSLLVGIRCVLKIMAKVSVFIYFHDKCILSLFPIRLFFSFWDALQILLNSNNKKWKRNGKQQQPEMKQNEFSWEKK